jgi:DNA-binding CsgD family transcriptional regulator
MTRALRRSDLASALAFVHEAGEADGSEDFRRRVLEGLPRLVPASMISYNDISPDGDPILLLDPMDAWTAARERAFLRLAGQNPLIAHYLRTGDPRPMKISDLMDRRAFRATELYRSVYGPMGVEFQMALPLPAGPGAVVGIALNRDRVDFGERDRAMLELLRPHLARLRRDAAARDRVRTLAAVTEGALGARAAVAVTPEGTVAYASAGAAALAARHLPPPARASELPAPLGRWWRASRLHRPAAPPDLVAEGPSGRLVARLLPSADPGAHDVILLEERADAPDLAALVALGLSPRQAEVLALVAAGATNAAAAARLGISPRTVQKHLEHVYDRLGVRSRTAAASLASASLPPG